MAVRDGAKYLTAAIDSVQGQTFEDLELIVVDDGSTDRTPEILADAARLDERIRVVSMAGKRRFSRSQSRLQGCAGALSGDPRRRRRGPAGAPGAPGSIHGRATRDRRPRRGRDPDRRGRCRVRHRRLSERRRRGRSPAALGAGAGDAVGSDDPGRGVPGHVGLPPGDGGRPGLRPLAADRGARPHHEPARSRGSLPNPRQPEALRATSKRQRSPFASHSPPPGAARAGSRIRSTTPVLRTAPWPLPWGSARTRSPIRRSTTRSGSREAWRGAGIASAAAPIWRLCAARTAASSDPRATRVRLLRARADAYASAGLRLRALGLRARIAILTPRSTAARLRHRLFARGAS